MSFFYRNLQRAKQRTDVVKAEATDRGWVIEVDNGEISCITKRDFNTAKRKEAAASGAALPDGSFPIYNGEDLGNAIHLAGHASNPAKAKAHIRSRAAALGMSSRIPSNWGKSEEEVTKAVCSKCGGDHADNACMVKGMQEGDDDEEEGKDKDCPVEKSDDILHKLEGLHNQVGELIKAWGAKGAKAEGVGSPKAAMKKEDEVQELSKAEVLAKAGIEVKDEEDPKYGVYSHSLGGKRIGHTVKAVHDGTIGWTAVPQSGSIKGKFKNQDEAKQYLADECGARMNEEETVARSQPQKPQQARR